MSYIGQGLPADTFQGFVTDSFTGDGSATTFTLSKEPFSEDTLIVVINNVIQKPTTNFTVSGTTLTIVGTAVASGDVIYAIHMGGPLPIGGASELDLNGASDKLILDADGDSTISADTDDQIDFKLGGVDEMTMSSSGIVINESSNDRDVRIESNGNANMLFVDGGNDVVVVGSSVSETRVGQPLAITASGGTDRGGMAINSFLASSNGPLFDFSKSRNNTAGSHTVVQNGDALGTIIARGDDGDEFVDAAFIAFDVDGTPGNGDMPGRIILGTTADGASGGTERMRITNNGTARFEPGSNSRFYRIDPDVDAFYPTVNDVSDLGYSNLKWDDVYATNGTIQTSDKNVKDNITESDLGLDFVNKLKPVSYKFKEKTRTHYGLIAQDIEEVLSDISKSTTDFAGFIKTQKEDHSLWTKDDVETQDGSEHLGDFKNPLGTKIDGEYSYALRYEEFISPIIKAIQELSAKVKALEEA